MVDHASIVIPILPAATRTGIQQHADKYQIQLSTATIVIRGTNILQQHIAQITRWGFKVPPAAVVRDDQIGIVGTGFLCHDLHTVIEHGIIINEVLECASPSSFKKPATALSYGSSTEQCGQRLAVSSLRCDGHASLRGHRCRVPHLVCNSLRLFWPPSRPGHLRESDRPVGTHAARHQYPAR